MNLRQFSIALLISALPLVSSAGSAVSFNAGDFLSAKPVSRDGKTILKVKLSKSGKAKMRKLNHS
ncbi:MAG: hypothetical protein KDD50_00795, partial [Bdellovibrionales bacterium]|nr:hypothetical protein [Bdellovibrionales bacterium]